MDEAASDKPVSTSRTAPATSGARSATGDRSVSAGRRTEASRDTLAPQIDAVEAARQRLGDDLETLNREVRAQMGMTLEKLAWKAAVVGAAMVAGLGTQKALTAAWKAAKHSDPPTNPANPRTGWGDAITWTLATAVSAALAKIVAARAAAAGWEKATGTLPPGLEDR